MLVIYDPGQDEVTKFFTALRRRTLSAAKFFRRASARAEIELDKWYSSSLNFAPAVCIGLPGLLTVATILSDDSQYRLIIAIAGSAFVFAGLSISIWKYFRVGVSAVVSVFLIFLNGLSKIVYSTVKAGHAFDFISVIVRTQFLPVSSRSRFRIEKVEVDIDRSKVPGRAFRIHRGIVEDRRDVDALATWIISKLPSTA